MGHRYIPHSENEIREMLQRIGFKNIDDLFKDIPAQYRLENLSLPNGKAESEVIRQMHDWSGNTLNGNDYAVFLGGGVYNHLIPSAIAPIAQRGEFLTAYTPYQPEVSQGSLQVFFEFQSMICELTGMDVGNASMYDGASAAAEAMLMACRVKHKMKFAVSEAIHPEYIEVMRTYAEPMGIEILILPFNPDTGITVPEDLKKVLTEDVAGFLVGYPNFFGMIENLKELREVSTGFLMVVHVNPIALGILKSPGAIGADIVCGEGQPLGGAMYLGGMTLGLLASKKEYIRNMPGRIIGETKDIDGHRGFVMILQTREQHIRRAKATSNICSNHAHNALVATLYLALLGKNGLKAVALQSARRAHILASRIERMERYRLRFSGPFFNEFVVESTLEPESLQKEMLEQCILGPLPLKRFYSESFYDHLSMFAVTEANRIEDIHFLAARMEELL
jgi:glycine dehydrogenase subunit 1